MTRQCKKCCASGVPLSPNGVCAACIERAVAEDPRMVRAGERAIALLGLLSPELAERGRTQIAVVVLLGFIARCRSRPRVLFIADEARAFDELVYDALEKGRSSDGEN